LVFSCRGRVEDPQLCALFPLNKLPLFDVNRAFEIGQALASSRLEASRGELEADLGLPHGVFAHTAPGKLVLFDIEGIGELLLDGLLIGVLLDTLELEVDADHVLVEGVLQRLVEIGARKPSKTRRLHAADDVRIVPAVFIPLVVPQLVLGVAFPALWRPVVQHLVVQRGVAFDDVNVKLPVFILPGLGVGPQSVDGEGLAG
jgi:hypothetical protein